MDCKRFEPHAHTYYSNVKFVDSINNPEKLIDKAVSLGLSGIAITDHSSLGAHVVASKYGQMIAETYPYFKVALGEEGYLCSSREKGGPYFHQIWIAKNKIGYKMIREMSSISWIKGYYDRGIFRTPILFDEVKDIVERYGKGNIVATSACLAGHASYHLNRYYETGDQNEYRSADEYVLWMKEVFGDDFYLEIAPGRSAEQLRVNTGMVSFAEKHNVKIVCGTDSHYLDKDDAYIHSIFLNAKSSSDRETDLFYKYAYLQSNEEIADNLVDTGLDFDELCANSSEIYDKIESFSIEHTQQVPVAEIASYPKKKMNTGYDTLNQLFNSDNEQERYWVNYCIDKLHEKNLYNDTYLSRLEEEAHVHKVVGERLDTCMFAYPIFLQHYIDIIWECGSTVGVGRGSACSALSHWLLGVTGLDPIVNDFPFFRYMNESTKELGDIDIDISPSLREKIFEKIREKRGGELGLAQVCTYGTIGSRSAIITAARGLGINNDNAEKISVMIGSERGFTYTLSDMVYGNESKGLKPNTLFIAECEKYTGLLDVAMKLEGVIDHVG